MNKKPKKPRQMPRTIPLEFREHPVGTREEVFAILRREGFVMVRGIGDKHWRRNDGIEAHLYGSGTKLRISGIGDPIDADFYEALGMMRDRIAGAADGSD